jgi:hypothetical protein
MMPKWSPQQGQIMLKKFELERRKTRQQTVQGVLGIAQTVFSQLGKWRQGHIATKIREAEAQARNAFDQMYLQFQYDPEYETFTNRFEDSAKNLYDKQTEKMAPDVQRAYDAKFKTLQGQYKTKVLGLSLEKGRADDKASTMWQLEQAIDKGDVKGVEKILFGEELVEQPKQPAASGAPVSIESWLESPEGRKSKTYGATAEEIEAYLENPDAAVKKYFTPTRQIRGRDTELTEEAYRRYLDAHARAYQKSAYTDRGEVREQPTVTRIPGAVENGLYTFGEAQKIFKESVYEINKRTATKGLKSMHPQEALELLNKTTEDGNYEFAPSLRPEDRDELETELTADLRELNYRIDKNEKDFRESAEGHFKNKYFSGTLSWGELLQASKNYEKLEFMTDQNDPTRSVHPNDAAQIFRWMKADANGRSSGGDDAALKDFQEQVFSRFFQAIDNKEADHYNLDKQINEARSEGLLDETGHAQLIRFNNQENPDEVLAGYLDQIKASSIDARLKGAVRTAFVQAYNKNYWVDGKVGGEINPDRWTQDELDRLYETLLMPHVEDHLVELHDRIMGADVEMYMGGTSRTGKIAKDVEELDDYEKVVRAISEGYFDELPKDQIPHVEKYVKFIRRNQLEWFDQMVDDSGFRRNWYKGMVAPRKSDYITDDSRLVVVDENDKEWSVQIVNNTEQWMEYKEDPVTNGAIRYAPDGMGYVYVDGKFRSVAELNNKGLIRQQKYGMGMVNKLYVRSQKAEENTGNPWIQIRQ